MKSGLRVIDRFAACSGLLAVGARRARRGLTILMYHRVLPRAESSGYPLRNLVILREAFERQVGWVARKARVVTVREGLELLHSGRAGEGRPLVAFTFDDGYADNAEHAAPVLEAHGVRGTFFVTTGFIGGQPFWFDRASCFFRRRTGSGAADSVGSLPPEIRPHMGSLDDWLGWLKTMDTECREKTLAALGASEVLPGCRPMTIEQLVAMSRSGHEIGAHTLTHPVLTQESPESVTRELVGSKREIEQWIGQSVSGFCYPNGSWSEAVRQACIDAGFAYATTTRRHLNLKSDDEFTLGRRWIAPDTTGKGGEYAKAAFAAEVLGLHDYFRDRLGRPRGPVGSPPRRPGRPLPRAA